MYFGSDRTPHKTTVILVISVQRIIAFMSLFIERLNQSLSNSELVPCRQCTPRARAGSVAEWSKALVLGTSHFDGVGSNPTAANFGFRLTVFSRRNWNGDGIVWNFWFLFKAMSRLTLTPVFYMICLFFCTLEIILYIFSFRRIY